MELRQLRDFVVLAEELHYARAASRLGIDQSPLSRRIKEFEQDLGILLFARTSRGTQLTPRGESLLPWARTILAAAEQAQKLLQSSGSVRATVRVLLCRDVPSRRLFAALSAFQRAHPEFLVSYAERSPDQQIDEIRAELADVGFSLSGRESEGLHIKSLWSNDACLVLPNECRIINSRQVMEKDEGHPRLGIIRGQGSSHAVRTKIEWLARQLSANSDMSEADSLRTLLCMISVGTCLGLVAPAQAEMIHPEDFTVRPMPQPRAQFTTRMIYRDREKVLAINALTQAIREAWQNDCARLSEKPGRVP